jgi:hypothetical protein
MLHVYAALAEKERSLIAQRTRDALKAAKARGVVLGNPNLAAVRDLAIASTKAEAEGLAKKPSPATPMLRRPNVEDRNGKIARVSPERRVVQLCPSRPDECVGAQ